MYFLYLLLVFSYCENIYAIQPETISSNNEIRLLIEEAGRLEKNSKHKGALDVYHKALQLTVDEKIFSEASYVYKKIGLVHYCMSSN